MTNQIFPVDFLYNKKGCTTRPECGLMVEMTKAKNAAYINGDVLAAVLPLKNYTCFPAFRNHIKKLYKGNVIRDARRAEREGFICGRFHPRTFAPDIVDIHHSAPERQGKPMKPHYLKSLEQVGGMPTKAYILKPPACGVHHDIYYGIFKPEAGYSLGPVTTNKKLIGYIKLNRRGNFAFYSMIIGHADFLKYGIMYALHFHIVDEILGRQRNSLHYIIYAGFEQGTDGLKLWKKKAGFVPGRLVNDNE